MADNETRPEPLNDTSPPDDRANAPAWITFVLGGAILCVAGIGFIAVYGVPGVGPANQQQIANAPPAAAPAPTSGNATPGNATPGNTSQPETTGSGAPATPKQ